MDLETNNNKEQILMIVPSKGEKLSKSQVQFNTLVKKIETLSIQLMEDKEKLQKLLSIYLRKVSPQNKKAAELQFELAKEFANAIHTLRLGSKQTEEVESVIIWLMNQSFSVIEPNKEKKEFFNLWSKQSYDEKEMKENFSKTVNHDLGTQIEEKGNEQDPSLGQKKTKKQIEKELKQMKHEEAKTKSIRNIYISLAKMLHPDTVSDLAEKKEKEELMKKVTVAYNCKNLSELLKLEMKWVASESNQRKNMPEERLKLYISQLQEQVFELEKEHSLLRRDPCYIALVDLFNVSDKTALKKIKELSRIGESRVATLEHIVRVLQRNPTRKTVLDYLKEFSLLKDF